MITDKMVEAALTTIENPENAAAARANRLKLEYMLKHTKAMIMSDYKSLPVSAQERNAYKDKRYVEAVEELRQAIYADELQKGYREAASTTIDAWRTQQASLRVTI
tara:strand:- start:3286 stop:3603 length:318 start_codon:yes stop_codon:yes gene_type:complete